MVGNGINGNSIGWVPASLCHGQSAGGAPEVFFDVKTVSYI